MIHYDWIVVGGGVTGAALAYELVKQGLSVLLLDQQTSGRPNQSSYGGIAYWASTTPLAQQLYAESRHRYPVLAEELGAEVQFRELDLLLTIPRDRDPQTVAATYAPFGTPPQLLTLDETCELEPLLNPDAIAGALTVRHGHVHPELLTQAYLQAFARLGGQYQIGQVVNFTQVGLQITGTITPTGTYRAQQTVICAGGWSRSLLQQQGVRLPLYFTHAEAIVTPPTDLKLRTLVMPAVTQRFQLEAQASDSEIETQWQQPDAELLPAILDAGAVQFLDGSLRMGQISRVLSNPNAAIDASESETKIRAQVGQILPALGSLPGTWHHCLVAFSRDRLPLVGPVPGRDGLYVFSGFSNPFALIPSVAQRFAQHLVGQSDAIVSQLSPTRFLDEQARN